MVSVVWSANLSINVDERVALLLLKKELTWRQNVLMPQKYLIVIICEVLRYKRLFSSMTYENIYILKHNSNKVLSNVFIDLKIRIFI